ncbi:YdcF family protein [Aestuariispira insulae]|uniref:Uncharacterized SAM-binding protein YcdF (DUF218 family) n=1 Tax=Aestuariispira insulae TaxID=1461337 RepID=A0A3D9H6C0_9PROT|nr:YdcF family protein [Aestuariispira insulae]RED45055.1 uncharacterized SAM-binding protein YcdF (DUF218 family) [Aestuariispira insulae]
MFGKRRPRKTSIAGSLIIFAAISWIVGLLFFVAAIPDKVTDDGSKSEAIVVLTGGSMRLETGLDLLSKGAADKLFVSGVHRGVDVAELLRVSRQSPGKLDCCIALGYEASDTHGNAVETANWVRENGFKKVRLVTASYHMPRSLLELRHVMPELEVQPHPVFPDHVKTDSWYRWPGTAALLVGEYLKLLLMPMRWLWIDLVG